MKKTLILASILILSLSGCTKKFYEPDYTPPSAPHGLRTATGDNFIELFWDENRESDVDGYNVYVASTYSGRYQLIGTSRSAYFADKGALNGNTYYYAVTAFDFDGNESELSKDVAYDIARPEGYNVVLNNFRAVASTSGYDFSAYAVVPYTDQYADMWYDNDNGSFYIDVDTDSDIQDVGPTSSVLDISVAPDKGWSSTHDALLVVGHTYVVWTWDDHYAKFRVSAISPTRVVFDWAYQLQASNPMMKRAVTSSVRTRPPGNVLRAR